MFCAGENLCSHFFTTSLCGKLAGIQGTSFQYDRASEDRISAFIMFCFAEVDDIGLEVPVLHTGYTHTEFSFFTA